MRSSTSSSRPRTRCGVEPLYELSHARPAWRPVRPRSRRWEKNSSGLQLVQRPQALTRSASHAEPLELAANRERQVEAPVGHHVIAVAAGAKRLPDLVPDLVAAGADARPERRVNLPWRSAVQRREGSLDDAGRDSAPTAMDRRDGAR